ncbi:DnaB-like helicase C-terminal domain-containing protein, partial [Bacillus cereus]
GEAVKRIASVSMQRKGLQLTDRLRKTFLDPKLTLDQRGDAASQEVSQFVLQIQSLAQRRNVTLFEDIDTNTRTFEANQRALAAGDTTVFGIQSGYASIDIDMQMNGFKRGNLYIVAARPGTGKTSFLLNLALAAMKQGARVT